jgi:hypothetical protein
MPQFVLELGDSTSHRAFDALPAISQGLIECCFFMGVEIDGDTGDTTTGDDTPGIDALKPGDLNALASDAARFHLANLETLNAATESGAYDMAQAGRDLWFAGQGHGVGYDDRDLGDAGDALQAAALYSLESVFLSMDGESVNVDGVAPGFTPAQWAEYDAATGRATAPDLSTSATRYGATLGRRDTLDTLPEPERLYAVAMSIDSGGYDAGGAYWGRGLPMWRVIDPQTDGESFQRGATASDACAAAYLDAVQAVERLRAELAGAVDDLDRATDTGADLYRVAACERRLADLQTRLGEALSAESAQ